jgi:hypothetical protein
MNTEIYIENYRLDLTKDISALLNFAIDDIKDFSARSTTWSKTIVLPGTANNNKLFGHIFQVGHANFYNPTENNVGYNFNASKSADCIIFQDHMQTFRGVLRLMQVNIIDGRPEYEVSVFGKLAGLNVALSSGLLEDLDFSAYDDVYNTTNIIASWDNTPGTGVYYPLIDYGNYGSNVKHDWDILTFRPALYVREYIDKMFTAAGYRWESDMMDTDRFKRLIVPHNQKTLQGISTYLLQANRTGDVTALQSGVSTSYLFQWETDDTSIFTPDGFNQRYTYNGSTVGTTITFTFEGTRQSQVTDFRCRILKNGVEVPGASQLFTSYGGTTVYGWIWSHTFSTTLNTGDYFEFVFDAVSSLVGTYEFIITEATFAVNSSAGVVVPILNGDTIQLDYAIPKNIRQIDFLVSVVKLFNLYVWEDRFDPSLIYLKPFIDFYSDTNTNAVDWTYKLNRNKAIKIKPMSELNAKKYEFKFKQDSDYFNDLYRKRYGQGYGDYTFDSEFEFTEQTKSFEVIFSATPLVGYGGEEKVYSTIFKRTGPDDAPVEENTDSNIRILQTKKVEGVVEWDILDDVSVLSSITKYGYAGHFDDPDNPNNDLNFGALRELFFVLTTGSLSATQFNVFWSGYMAEITDKDSKLMVASFYLTPKDILELDFSKYVFVDGVSFRLNKISDYNASKPMDCKVELLKVNYTTYVDDASGAVALDNFFLWTDDLPLLDYDNDEILYI